MSEVNVDAQLMREEQTLRLIKEKIVRALEDCLCDDTEIANMEKGGTLRDEFPL